MQSVALDTYSVDQIFKALPILLILGLVFFLIGLVKYLWDLNRSVAIPVIVFISPVLIFLLLTTIYPAFQFLPYHRIKWWGDPTAPGVPCPYQSPQSWLFLRLAIFFKTLLSNPFKYILGLWNVERAKRRKLDYFFSRQPVASPNDPQSDWIQHGLAWLRQRDIDFLLANPATLEKFSIQDKKAKDAQTSDLVDTLCYPNQEFPPIYDSVKALLRVKADFEASGSRKMPELLQCFHDLTNFTYGIDSQHESSLAKYVDALLPTPAHQDTAGKDPYLPLPEFSQTMPRNLKLDIVLTRGRLLFLNHRHPHPQDSQFVTLNHLEMFVRVIHFAVEQENDAAGKWIMSHFPGYILSSKLLDPKAAQFRGRVYRQMLEILRLSLRSAVLRAHTSDILRTIAGVIGLGAADQHLQYAELEHTRILQELCSSVGNPDFRHDGLFFVGALYVRELLELKQPYLYNPPSVFVKLIVELRKYKQKNQVAHFEDYLKREVHKGPGQKKYSHRLLDFLDYDFGLVLGNGRSDWKQKKFASLFPHDNPTGPKIPRFPNTIAGESLDFGTTGLIFPYPFEFREEDRGEDEAPFVITHVHHTPFPTYFAADNSPIPRFVRLVIAPPPKHKDMIPVNHLQK